MYSKRSRLLKNTYMHMYVRETFFILLCTFQIFYNEHQSILELES